jgi:hypothetical protein
MERNYPTLNLIDRAVNNPDLAFATAANADMLERRARALADAYWSDLVWLTGAISKEALDRVTTELQALRIAPAISSTGPTSEPTTDHAVLAEIAA